ncbi:hypothetical protein T484DRAFT_1745829 [Baffinella frigidus]|nr:hypothetical protein T484DRAFT_1745829 [Cryptophyta sp. CCMP2293]
MLAWRSTTALLLLLLLLAVPASPFVVPLRGVSSRRTRHVSCRHANRVSMVTAARSEPGGGDVFLLKWQLIQDTFHARAEAAFRAACEKWPSEMSEVLELTPNEGGVRKAWVGGDWSKFADNAEEKASGAMPRWLQEKLRIIAPVVATTGGESVPTLAFQVRVSRPSPDTCRYEATLF